jgi:hypothetical protein
VRLWADVEIRIFAVIIKSFFDVGQKTWSAGKISESCGWNRNALHFPHHHKEDAMTAAAERMRALRERRKANHLREVRIVALDARSPEVRKMIAEQVAAMNKEEEREVLEWMEKVADLSDWTWPE